VIDHYLVTARLRRKNSYEYSNKWPRTEGLPGRMGGGEGRFTVPAKSSAGHVTFWLGGDGRRLRVMSYKKCNGVIGGVLLQAIGLINTPGGAGDGLPYWSRWVDRTTSLRGPGVSD